MDGVYVKNNDLYLPGRRQGTFTAEDAFEEAIRIYKKDPEYAAAEQRYEAKRRSLYNTDGMSADGAIRDIGTIPHTIHQLMIWLTGDVDFWEDMKHVNMFFSRFSKFRAGRSNS